MAGDASVRAAREADLPELTEIYNHYVRSSHVTFDVDPFKPEQRLEWFRRHAGNGPHRLLVAVGPGGILGYASSGPFRPRPAYRTTIETSVYCRPDATGLGLGTMLYERLFDELGREDVHRACAGVTLPNEPSLSLHRRFGFSAIGTFTEVGFKFGRYWDVIWLEKAL